MKTLKFVGKSLDDLRDFPESARQRAGRQLHKVQKGEDPYDWKPMSGIGPGVKELRIHAEGQYRVIYVAKFKDAIYVLHAFQKKTQKTRQQDIELAKKRYKALQSKREVSR